MPSEIVATSLAKRTPNTVTTTGLSLDNGADNSTRDAHANDRCSVPAVDDDNHAFILSPVNSRAQRRLRGSSMTMPSATTIWARISDLVRVTPRRFG